LVAKGAIQNIISQDILDEVQGVLIQRFAWERKKAQDAIGWPRLVSEIVQPG
jgi:hypothetical protein